MMLPPLPWRALAWAAVVMVFMISAVLVWDEFANPDVIRLTMH